MNDAVYPVAYADRPNEYHWKQDSITWEALTAMVTGTPARRKECGNYILATLDRTEKVHAGADGPCTDIHRDNRSVSRRSAVLALDIDNPDDGFDVTVEMVLAGHAYLLHTTFSSTPAEPRYRLLVQVDRDMAPDEYVAAAQAMAVRLGEEQFDSGSFQAARYMFKPGAKKREWYESWVGEGEPVAVDTLLAEWDRDLSEMPMPTPSRTKRDPFNIGGPIGAFNRVYVDLDDLIEAYALPYERVSDDRYSLTGSKAEAGMGPVSGAPGLFYSHHANDPAYGVTCSAFDLVRLHWFSELDESAKPGTPVNRLPSHEQMMETATKDKRVIEEIFSSQTDDIKNDFDAITPDDADDGDDTGPSWRSRLTLTARGKFIDNIHNTDLIRRNDPVFATLRHNLMTEAVEVAGDWLPWRAVTGATRLFTDSDHIALRWYLERTYAYEPKVDKTRDMVLAHASENPIVPVLAYLESLVWDGKPRIATCLPGAEHNDYNAMVARKILTSAVARMYRPGMKWDHTMVLHGGEGLGKSLWIDRMATVGPPGEDRQTYSASLGPINSKDTLLTAHRSWIMTADEGHSLRKADNDALKEFLTRTHDVFRMPYTRDTKAYPRRFVVWSTTNDDTFLQRQEGNRRFLVVRCLEKFDIDAMTPDYVDQVWAEAVVLFKAGERMYLHEEEAMVAKEEREPFLEEDAHAGTISEFLETLVPEDWYERSADSRMQWLEDRSQGFEPEGTMAIDRTCTQQIWYEVLRQGRTRAKAPRTELLEIGKSLRALGWVPSGTQRFPGHGPQVIFVNGQDLL
jgi:predicted P-loop ATPase